MPTPASSFAAVAALLAGVDAADNDAVEEFYDKAFTRYPPRAQALIADFLVGLSDDPTEDELRTLKATLALPAERLPELESPPRTAKLPVLAATTGARPVPRMIDASIGTRIRRRRAALRMTEEQLSMALELTPRELRQYEAGTAGMPAALLHEVSRALHVPVGFFFEDLPGSTSTTRSRLLNGFSENTVFSEEAAPYRAAVGGFREPHTGFDDPAPEADTDKAELVRMYDRIANPADRRRALALVSGLQSEQR